jgi:hypothetical protein
MEMVRINDRSREDRKLAFKKLSYLRLEMNWNKMEAVKKLA